MIDADDSLPCGIRVAANIFAGTSRKIGDDSIGRNVRS